MCTSKQEYGHKHVHEHEHDHDHEHEHEHEQEHEHEITASHTTPSHHHHSTITSSEPLPLLPTLRGHNSDPDYLRDETHDGLTWYGQITVRGIGGMHVVRMEGEAYRAITIDQKKKM